MPYKINKAPRYASDRSGLSRLGALSFSGRPAAACSHTCLISSDMGSQISDSFARPFSRFHCTVCRRLFLCKENTLGQRAPHFIPVNFDFEPQIFGIIKNMNTRQFQVSRPWEVLHPSAFTISSEKMQFPQAWERLHIPPLAWQFERIFWLFRPFAWYVSYWSLFCFLLL